MTVVAIKTQGEIFISKDRTLDQVRSSIRDGVPVVTKQLSSQTGVWEDVRILPLNPSDVLLVEYEEDKTNG